jgi:uncharacterized protein (TIGR02246 family)
MTDTSVENQKVRSVIDKWLAASKSGDLETILTLMTDDAIFLTRNGVMRREDFVASFKAMAGNVEIDGRPDIQEITMEGDLAVCWNKLEVRIKPSTGNEIAHAGNILTVFRRSPDGQWRLWRDANLLAPV